MNDQNKPWCCSVSTAEIPKNSDRSYILVSPHTLFTIMLNSWDKIKLLELGRFIVFLVDGFEVV